MYIKPRNIVADLQGLRPFDSSFRPILSLRCTTIPPIPFIEVGFDYTIMPPKGHLSPSKINAASLKRSATANAYVTEKEKKKLAQDGHCDPYNHTSFTGEQIDNDLLKTNMVFIPVAISPYGCWGPCFTSSFLAPCQRRPSSSLRCVRKPSKCMTGPCHISLPLESSLWPHKKWMAEKAHIQHFYENSYTAPTPKEYILQKLDI